MSPFIVLILLYGMVNISMSVLAVLKEKKKYFDILKNVKDITSVQSIARLWKYENIRLDKIEEASGEFDYLVKEIHSIISDEGDNIK